jgi:O-antigen/teichoic acid export membrane protein
MSKSLWGISIPVGAQVFATRVAGYGFGVITAVLVARMLGPRDRGIWSVALLVAGLLTLVAESGIGTSTLYLIRRFRERRDAVITASVSIVLALSLGWVVVMLALVRGGGVPLFEGVPTAALAVAIVSAIPMSVTMVARYNLLSFEDTDGSNQSTLFQAISLTSLLAPVLLFRGGAVPAICAYLVSAVATLAFTGGRLLWRHRVQSRWDVALLRPLLSYGVKSHVGSIALFLTYRVDVLIVNYYLGLSAAGIYSVSIALSEILRGIPETAQIVVLSRSGGNVGSESESVCRITLAATVVFGVFLAISSHWMVPLVFGSSYEGASGAFLLLFPGVLGLAVSYSVSPMLALSGDVGVSVRAALVALVVMVVIDIRAVPAWGLPGAAFASSVAYWVLAGLQLRWLSAMGVLRLRNLVPRREDFLSRIRA